MAEGSAPLRSKSSQLEANRPIPPCPLGHGVCVPLASVLDFLNTEIFLKCCRNHQSLRYGMQHGASWKHALACRYSCFAKVLRISNDAASNQLLSRERLPNGPFAAASKCSTAVIYARFFTEQFLHPVRKLQGRLNRPRKFTDSGDGILCQGQHTLFNPILVHEFYLF